MAVAITIPSVPLWAGLVLLLCAPVLAVAEAETPATRVAAFIADYDQWNQQWVERIGLRQGAPASSMDASNDEIEAGYSQIIRRHFVAGIQWDGYRLSTDSLFSTGESVIAVLAERGDSAVVEVRKRVGSWSDAEYIHEFELARVDGCWRIAALYAYIGDREGARLRML
jgi:hypothetical protein